MNELEKLSKQGWRFVVWLIPPDKGCIIQGKFCDEPEDSGDWDFDVKAMSFEVAVILALNEVGRIASPNGHPAQP